MKKYLIIIIILFIFWINNSLNAQLLDKNSFQLIIQNLNTKIYEYNPIKTRQVNQINSLALIKSDSGYELMAFQLDENKIKNTSKLKINREAHYYDAGYLNNDNLIDIAIIDKSALKVYYQKKDLTFSNIPDNQFPLTIIDQNDYQRPQKNNFIYNLDGLAEDELAIYDNARIKIFQIKKNNLEQVNTILLKKKLEVKKEIIPFEAVTSYKVMHYLPKYFWQDLNNDNKLELIVHFYNIRGFNNKENGLYVFRQISLSLFKPVYFGQYHSIAAIHDLDNNSISDIITSYGYKREEIARDNRTISFKILYLKQDLQLDKESEIKYTGYKSEIFIIDDFNNDKKMDLVIRNYLTNSTVLLELYTKKSTNFPVYLHEQKFTNKQKNHFSSNHEASFKLLETINTIDQYTFDDLDQNKQLDFLQYKYWMNTKELEIFSYKRKNKFRFNKDKILKLDAKAVSSSMQCGLLSAGNKKYYWFFFYRDKNLYFLENKNY